MTKLSIFINRIISKVKSGLTFLFLPNEFFTARKTVKQLALGYLGFMHFWECVIYAWIFYPIYTLPHHFSQIEILYYFILEPIVFIFPLLIIFGLFNKHVVQVAIYLINKKPVSGRLFGVLCLFFILTISTLYVYLASLLSI